MLVIVSINIRETLNRHGSKIMVVAIAGAILIAANTVIGIAENRTVAESELMPVYMVEGTSALFNTGDPIDKVVSIPIDDSNTTIEVGLSKKYLAANLEEIDTNVEGLAEGVVGYSDYDIQISSVDIQETQEELARIAEEEKQKAILAEAAAKAEAEKKAKEAAMQAAKDAQQGTAKSIPNVASNFKSYMDYRCITSKNSTQYKLQHDGNATTNSEGFRMYNGEYMVAVGSYYAKYCGTRLRITLDSGKQFYAIVGDQKSDAHTDALNQHRNGNIVEFIVDQKAIPSVCKQRGDMSYAPNAGLTGKIAAIEVLS